MTLEYKRVISAIVLTFCLSGIVSCRHAETTGRARPEIAIPPLSEDCGEADFAKFGRPIMLETRKGIFLGVSAGNGDAVYASSVRLYFWIQNRTDSAQVISSCWDVDWFRRYGFNVYEGEGHRLRSMDEEKYHNSTGTACPEDVIVCESTAQFMVLPHTCRPPDRSEAYNLANYYSLAPGQYTLRLADLSSCKAGAAMENPWEPVQSLTVKEKQPASLTIRIDP
jgi:hypothetical protein